VASSRFVKGKGEGGPPRSIPVGARQLDFKKRSRKRERLKIAKENGIERVGTAVQTWTTGMKPKEKGRT